MFIVNKKTRTRRRDRILHRIQDSLSECSSSATESHQSDLSAARRCFCGMAYEAKKNIKKTFAPTDHPHAAGTHLAVSQNTLTWPLK